MICCFLALVALSYSHEQKINGARETADPTWTKLCVCEGQDSCNTKCPTGYTVQTVSAFTSGMTGYITNGYPDYLDILIVSAIPNDFNIDISKTGLTDTIITNINQNKIPYIWIKNIATTVKKIVFTKVKVNVMINQLTPNDISFKEGSTMVLDCSITKLEVGSDRVRVTKYLAALEETIVMIKDSTIEDINRWKDDVNHLSVISGIYGIPGNEKISGNKVVITGGKDKCDTYIDAMETDAEYKQISINSKDFALNVTITVERGTKFADIAESPKGATFTVVPRHPIERNIFPIDYMDCHFFRIPAMATAIDGTLIAVVDARWTRAGDLPNNISVVVRRSLDNGVTWTDPIIITDPKNTKGFGDPSIVVDRKSGRIFIMYNGLNGFAASTVTNPIHNFICHSDDNGATWSEQVDITGQVYSNLCTECDDYARNSIFGMFLTSGASLQLRDGRLMVASVTRTASGTGTTQNYAVYSDDLGETWHLGKEKSNDAANEAKLIEKDNGTVVIVVRQKSNRKFVFSNDRGDTWYGLVQKTDIFDPGCDGDAIKYTSTADGYDKNRWIITIPYFKNIRKNVSVLLSYDEGLTWPVKKSIDIGFSGYSSVTVDRNGHMHILYEKNLNYAADVGLFHMPVTEFTLEWLTDGKDTYTKPTKINWCICDNAEECAQCKQEGHFPFNNKAFDNYIESYYEYLPSMKYEIISGKARDFFIDLDKPGLNGPEGGLYSYVQQPAKNTKSGESDEERKAPTATLIGDVKEAKKLQFKGIPVKIKDFDQIANNKLNLVSITEGKIILNDDSVQKIEIGKTKIRLTKRGQIQTKEIDFTGDIVIYNSQANLEIHSGVDGNANEDTSYNRIYITSDGNTKLHFSGKWKNTTEIKPLIFHYQKSGYSDMKWDSFYNGLTNITVCPPCIDQGGNSDGGSSGGNKNNDGKTVSFTVFIATAAALVVVVVILVIALICVIVKKPRRGEDGSAPPKTLNESLFF